jgi:hypothetical protein
MTGRRRISRSSGIDGGEGRGVRLGGSDPGAPLTGWASRPGHPEYLDDEDDTLIVDPVPVNDFSELEDEEDGLPSDRRRDPLRRKL